MTHIQREPTPEERFGRLVRAAREAREWTQEALVRHLKDAGLTLDQSGVARIESGKRLVRLNEVVALAKVLGIDLQAIDLTDHAVDVRNIEAALRTAEEQAAEQDELVKRLTTDLEMVTWTRDRAVARRAWTLTTIERYRSMLERAQLDRVETGDPDGEH